MKKIVVLTGAGMSVESGLKTFRDADGLWEEYPVQQVATHEGWLADPTLVTNFYNMLRKKCWGVKPNEGHKLVAKLEEQYDVTVVTQNVDNLHEMAGSSKVIHLHGELMKVCSSRDVDDPRYQIQLYTNYQVHAYVWRVNVGRVKLYLLDTDNEMNSDFDKPITHALYGGDWENRLKQEILLGIGGMLMLKKLGIKKDIYHCNEGHAALCNLQRLCDYIDEEGLTFNQALELVRASSLYTVHNKVIYNT